MIYLEQLFHSIHIVALLVGFVVFLFTVFLAAKGWITISQTFLLLLFSLAAGTLINNQAYFHHKTTLNDPIFASENTDNHFQDQMVQALENIRTELNYDRESLQHIVSQLDELFNQVDLQRRKFEHFIDDTRDRFKAEAEKKPESLLK